MQFSQAESQVIVDLVLMYKNLYQLTPDEVAKEKTMLAVLQKYHAAAENLSDSVKHSGDLKVWITIDGNPDDEKEVILCSSFGFSLTFESSLGKDSNQRHPYAHQNRLRSLQGAGSSSQTRTSLGYT